jgi:peptidyl-prolyl cis-trans isomerase C
MNQSNAGKAVGKSLRNKVSALIREPLIGFLVIGVSIYLLYGWLANQTSTEPDNTITITASETEWLEQTWQKRWNRPPTDNEMQGLIDTYVKETIMYKQALAMGLDKGDTIVRRRLAQKLEFLTKDLTQVASPSIQELRAYFDSHKDRYTPPVRLSFTHIYFSPDKRGNNASQDAIDTLTKLKNENISADNAKKMGDTFMLQRYYPDKTEQEILRLFGNEFSQKTFQLPADQWTGPVQSGYGLHLVYIHDRIEPKMPEWADMQDLVLQDWVDDKRVEINEKFYTTLLSRYKVIVEEKEAEKETLVSGKI